MPITLHRSSIDGCFHRQRSILIVHRQASIKGAASCSTPSSSSAPAPSGWPRGPRPRRAACAHDRAGGRRRRRRRRSASGGTCGSSRPGPSSSTRWPPTLLALSGWVAPGPRRLPDRRRVGGGATSQPLAEALAATDDVEMRFGHRVIGVARRGRDRHGRRRPGERAVRPCTSSTPDGTARIVAERRDRCVRHLDAARTRWAPTGYPAPGRAEHARPHHLRHPRLHRRRRPRRATPASTSRWPAPAPPPRTPWSGWPGSPPRTRHQGDLARTPCADGGRLRRR